MNIQFHVKPAKVNQGTKANLIASRQAENRFK